MFHGCSKDAMGAPYVTDICIALNYWGKHEKDGNSGHWTNKKATSNISDTRRGLYWYLVALLSYRNKWSEFRPFACGDHQWLVTSGRHLPVNTYFTCGAIYRPPHVPS